MVDAKLVDLEVLTEEVLNQVSKRKVIFDTYMNLFEAAVSKKIDGEVFEILVTDLKEQSENITAIAIDNIEFIMCELEIASKFELLFSQREVSEILQTVKTIPKSLTNLVVIFESFMKPIVSGVLKENSIDVAEFAKLLGVDYLN